ncbi:MAG TPA: DUF3768 domain-containing protein [Candidatus Cloacimonas sp.]|nr:DUF3768 domain-containing protein [Candidatus Cloacimonas sp.]HPS60800.1 DUF3768 domain-containing protein [Candidatus Cloacimonas sp.]
MNEIKDGSSKVAELNDKARRLLPTGFQPSVTTFGIQDKFPDPRALLTEIANFNTFTEENDPYGEHDFGSINFGEDKSRNIKGTKVFWKIDYYAPDLIGGIDPLDPACVRIITIMLAEEY